MSNLKKYALTPTAVHHLLDGDDNPMYADGPDGTPDKARPMLAHMFGPKVRANVIQPGPFLTDISKTWDLEAFDAEAKKSIPLQRGGLPDEIIGAALYLASDASSYTTGSVVKVDGGMTW